MGMRTPYLDHDPAVREVLHEAGFLYDRWGRAGGTASKGCCEGLPEGLAVWVCPGVGLAWVGLGCCTTTNTLPLSCTQPLQLHHRGF